MQHTIDERNSRVLTIKTKYNASLNSRNKLTESNSISDGRTDFVLLALISLPMFRSSHSSSSYIHVTQ